ncbi:MAG: histidinol-phosphatase, partial [Gemmatimonadota bacterium]|nr:histidinol-phosphatase [Gemmatimonadota bacterium]
RAAAAGLDRIAVTDHGRIDGALAAAALDPARVIVGQELRCREEVDLIGLFLREELPDGLPVVEAAAAIRAQGGVVYVPHPYAYLTRSAERAARVLAVADVVEVFNARAFVPTWNRRAAGAAVAAGLPAFASSDAHFPWEIGRAWTELPPFDDAASFLAAARESLPVGHRLGSPLLHVASMALSLSRGGRIEL